MKSTKTKRSAVKATKPAAPKRSRARPTKFTPEIAAAICAQLADGKSLRSICTAADMPDEKAVRTWALDDVGGFGPQYARAREIGYERLAEEILAIADTPLPGIKTTTKATGVEVTEGDMIEHRRLQVDTRKWMLAKMLPKRYGDRTTLAGDAENPLTVLTMEQIAANPRSRLAVK